MNKKKNKVRVQLPAASSFSGNNITQSNLNVKSDTSSTKYSMQESQNNTQNTNNLNLLKTKTI